MLFRRASTFIYLLFWGGGGGWGGSNKASQTTTPCPSPQFKSHVESSFSTDCRQSCLNSGVCVEGKCQCPPQYEGTSCEHGREARGLKPGSNGDESCMRVE